MQDIPILIYDPANRANNPTMTNDNTNKEQIPRNGRINVSRRRTYTIHDPQMKQFQSKFHQQQSSPSRNVASSDITDTQIKNSKLRRINYLEPFTSSRSPNPPTQRTRPGTYVVTQRRSRSPETPSSNIDRNRARVVSKPDPSFSGPSKAELTDLIDQHILFDSPKARSDLMSYVKSYIRKNTGQGRLQAWK